MVYNAEKAKNALAKLSKGTPYVKRGIVVVSVTIWRSVLWLARGMRPKPPARRGQWIGPDVVDARHTAHLPAAGQYQTTAMMACSFCGESILTSAKKCRYCGEVLDPALRASQEAMRLAQLSARAPTNVTFNQAIDSRASSSSEASATAVANTNGCSCSGCLMFLAALVAIYLVLVFGCGVALWSTARNVEEQERQATSRRAVEAIQSAPQEVPPLEVAPAVEPTPIAEEMPALEPEAAVRAPVDTLPPSTASPARPVTPFVMHAHPVRVWTGASGKTLRGSFAGMANGVVKIRREDGKMLEIALDKFSKKDQRDIRDAKID
jgi:hypothetical protein